MDDSQQLKDALSPLLDRNLRFPTRPKIVSDLHFFDMPDGLGVQIRGLEKPVILRGELAEDIIAWLLDSLDGTRDREEIIKRRPPNCSMESAVEALLLVFRKGLIHEAEEQIIRTETKADHDEVLHRQLLFWGRQVGATRANNSGHDVYHKLKGAKILLVGNGLFGAVACDLLERSGCENIEVIDWSADAFLAASIAANAANAIAPEVVAIRGAEFLESRINDLLPRADLLVTALRNSSDELFAIVNQICLREQKPWLRGHDNASSLEIGPFVDPYSSACFVCMRTRQISSGDHAIEEALYQKRIFESPLDSELIGESICTATLGASILCSEVIRIITMIERPSFENAVLTVTSGGTFTLNKFRRVPRCPDCYRGSHARISQEQATANT